MKKSVLSQVKTAANSIFSDGAQIRDVLNLAADRIAELEAAVWMVGNNDTPEDKARWWKNFGHIWKSCARKEVQKKADKISK
jgi:hypothetical protein